MKRDGVEGKEEQEQEQGMPESDLNSAATILDYEEAGKYKLRN